ncbi:MAG: sulfite exporter TauE/SafE family protein [Xanthomonadales bacterium]|nr:sulfite exporter TauE/SafE family protein [Xanthomonadales bacterium]MCE7931202.1 sulfite exporter TauE/SafE family protein [Xanthomonadales bacterium PRO6]
MIAELSLGGALLLGLVGSGHCLAMCGGIAGAFGVSAAPGRLIRVPLAASIGRIGAYATLGALAGGVGLGFGDWLRTPVGLHALRTLAALTLVLIGLQLAGALRLLDRVAIVAVPLWRRLQPLTRRLLPLDGARRAFAFGAFWGMLPCGLVYGMLALSLGTASPVQGALFMGAFGLGTLPALLGLGVAAGQGLQLGRGPVARRVVGSALALFGGLFFLAPWVLPERGPLAALRPLFDCH